MQRASQLRQSFAGCRRARGQAKMNSRLGLAAGLMTALALLSGCTAETPPMRADRLWLGEHLITLDDAYAGASALAVKGEKILWVGRREDWTGTADQVTELGERALLPGFIDAHGHLSFSARRARAANVASPPVGAVTGIASLQEVVSAHIAERGIAPGDWVLGVGYDDSLLEERRHPNRDDLDAVSQRHPIVLMHVSGHLAAANSLALQQVGVTADRPDPPGGQIRRRPGSREPDGVLEETAMAPLFPAFLGDGGLAAEDVRAVLANYASQGLTTVQDGAASLADYERFVEMAGEEGLPLDLTVYPRVDSAEFQLPLEAPLGEYRNRVKLAGVKLILDGSPQGKTAYLSQPYFEPPAGQPADYRGYPTMPQEAVDALVARFAGAGTPMLAHCNGDAAADMLLNAIERAGRDAPLGDHRTVMIHAQTVREDQLQRMAALGVLPSFFSAHAFYWGDWHRDSVLGPERAANISPTRSALAQGLAFSVHNDAPVVPPDMIRLLWATVNRITRSGQVLGAEQRIPVLEALRAVTVHAAWQAFEECCKGSLTPGKQADLVVLSRNPLQMPLEELLDLKVVETVARGASVFVAADSV